jgi:hypothetical protein
MWCGLTNVISQSFVGKSEVAPVLNYLSLAVRHTGEWRYSSTIFDLRNRWELSASRPGRFTPGEIAPGTHLTGGWVVPRASLEIVEKRKNLLLPGIESQPASPSIYRLSYPGSIFLEGLTKTVKG